MKLYDLKTNYQKDPLGIELSAVTLSWKVKEAAGKVQRSARVFVGEDEAFQNIVFDSGEGPWNSGAYTPGMNLKPGKRYFWKVAVTDETGDRAESGTAFFEGGHPEEPWHGTWIRAPFVRELHPVFRKEFVLNEQELAQIAAGRLYLCGLGVYEVYLNGEKVGEDFLTPYFTDYRYWIQYQTYDVGRYLKAGVNRMDVYLGNGWYKGRLGYLNHGQLREYYGDQFQLLADLYLTDACGRVKVIGTDETWLALKSPVLLSGIYDGEIYDSRMEPELEQMSEQMPERKKLQAVLAHEPKGELCPMMGPVVRKQMALPVKEVITTPAGETVLDFGQEITGWVEFLADGPEDAEITLQYGEVLQNGNFYRDNLRTAQAEYTYICNGKRQWTRPHFTFYGFRYVKVTGMKVEASNAGQFEAWVLHSDMEETGWIHTSDSKVNRLIENTKWSQRDNFLDIPTDCPQRDERLGWTGDAQIFSLTASYHMETGAFFRKYLKDMRLEQREKGGAVPYVVPDVLTLGRQMNGEPEFDMKEGMWGEAGASVWGDAATIIPWNLYLQYGNRTWLNEQYDNMKQWVQFMVNMDETYCGGKRLWTCGFHFGDWLSLDSEGDSREGGTDKYFVASMFYMYSAGLAAKAAGILEKHQDREEYEKLAAEVRAAIRSRYVCGEGTLTIRTQTAYVLGIWLDLFEKEEMKQAADQLCLLLKENQMHLSTGFVGTAYLCPALSKTGHWKEAYTLLLNEEYPGWLYEVNLGATTVWERWNSLLPDGSISSTGMNSLNHYAYGVVAEWIYRKVCGLEMKEETAGWKILHFAPQPDRRLSHAHAAYHSVAGDYKAGWEWKGDRIHFQIQVPFDCRAEFDVEMELAQITVNGEPTELENLKNGLPAGVYEIEAVVMEI